MSFATAKDNFYAAARERPRGAAVLASRGAQVPVTELLLRHLLPLARQGLLDWGVDEVDVEYYLGIIEERTSRG